MPLIPNYPLGHEKVGQTKALEDYSRDEALSHIRQVCDEARISVDNWRPVSREGLVEAAKLAKSLDDPEHMSTVEGMLAYVDTTTVRRGKTAIA